VNGGLDTVAGKKGRKAKAKATNAKRADQRSGFRKRDLAANAAGEIAFTRLVQNNEHGQLSLAGAYAFGYGALAIAQIQDDSTSWFDTIDPLDALFLGTIFPQNFRDEFEFGNARTAWLRLMRETECWDDIERFVAEVISASDEADLPVDDGKLMLRLCARLEAAGLDARKLPESLLPKNSLANARFVIGPDTSLELPTPPDDADARVLEFWADSSIKITETTSVLQAICVGLQLLSTIGIDEHEHSTLLLIGLYAALVPDDHRLVDLLSDMPDRAEAWALGLAPDSDLVDVTDILLIAATRDLSADRALRHIMALNAISKPVRRQDRIWHSAPGTSLTELAFDLGFTRVMTRSGDVVAISGVLAELYRKQFELFKQKYGFPPGPGDPVHFDTEAAEPTRMSVEDIRDTSLSLLQAIDIHPAWIYAHDRTGGLLPPIDGAFARTKDERDWFEAVDRYVRKHPEHGEVDHEAEVHRYQGGVAALTLSGAADGLEHARLLITSFRHASQDDPVFKTTSHLLFTLAPELIDNARERKKVRSTARQHASSWAGEDLALQLDQLVASDHSEISRETLPALLALFVATIENLKNSREGKMAKAL
jgi:hypothetical protein